VNQISIHGPILLMSIVSCFLIQVAKSQPSYVYVIGQHCRNRYLGTSRYPEKSGYVLFVFPFAERSTVQPHQRHTRPTIRYLSGRIWEQITMSQPCKIFYGIDTVEILKVSNRRCRVARVTRVDIITISHRFSSLYRTDTALNLTPLF
jgi:hypothetical protein